MTGEVFRVFRIVTPSLEHLAQLLLEPTSETTKKNISIGFANKSKVQMQH